MIQPIPFYNAPNQPPIIQDAARLAMRCMSIAEGYLTQDGRPVVPYDSESELPPSVARVVKWLDKHIDGQLTIECARAIGMPHKQQLKIAVEDLRDHGLVEMVVDNSETVFFLTDKGDLLAEEILDMNLPVIERKTDKIGGLFSF